MPRVRSIMLANHSSSEVQTDFIRLNASSALNVQASSFESHDDYYNSRVCLSSLILHSPSWLGNSEITKKHSTTSCVSGTDDSVGSLRTLTRLHGTPLGSPPSFRPRADASFFSRVSSRSSSRTLRKVNADLVSHRQSVEIY